MTKQRVYELARELGVESKEVLTRAQELDLEVKTASSGLEQHAIDLISRSFTDPGGAVAAAPAAAAANEEEENDLPTAEPPPPIVTDAGLSNELDQQRRSPAMGTSEQQERTGSQHGKTYEYQQSSQGGSTVPGSGATSTLLERRERLLGAFEDLVDAMVDTVQGQAPGTQPSPSGPGDQPGGTSAVGGGGGGENPTGPGGTYQPTKPTGGNTGATPGGGAGQAVGTSGTSTTSTGSTKPGPNGGSEAVGSVPVSALREDYRRGQARRETARQAEASGGAGPSGVFSTADNHQSDSSTAPLHTNQEFDPYYGKQGVGTSETMEVPRPAARNERPETAPQPPQSVAVPLDAYWASFGTPLDRAQESARLATQQQGDDQTSERMVMELIIGEDDRVLVTNNEAYPWRCICSLLITARTGNTYLGTGWLVGPRLVLTAGHCVYLADEGGWASQIEVIPGRRGSARPFGSTTSGDLRSVRGWTVKRERDYDYGAILLPEDARFGDQLGWFGYAVRDEDHLKNITLNLSGYPGDGGKAGLQREQGTQWFNSRGVKDVYDKQITYEIDTWGGQSGAPCWEMTPEGYRYGLAIHTWGTNISNGATRITSDVFDNIVLWAGQAS